MMKKTMKKVVAKKPAMKKPAVRKMAVGGMKGDPDPKKRKGATVTESKDKMTVSRTIPQSDNSMGAKFFLSDAARQLPSKQYQKTITGNDKTGGTLTVTKGGKTNTFNIPKGKVSSQRAIAKKETGYMKKGGKMTSARKKK
jgi:hypothetical protein